METTEQVLRREAIRRRLEGQRRCDICRDLGRSLRWFSKWWSEYQRHPGIDFSDGSRAPHTSPRRIPCHVEQAVISIRRALVAANSAETKYGLMGAAAIYAELERLHAEPLPSQPTIQRILARHGLTQRPRVVENTAYYPEPVAWEPNAIQATDIITRHLRGGQEVQNFHTFDHCSHAVHLSQRTDKTSASACAHFLAGWAELGLPLIQQLDNENAFCGGHTHPRVIGRVVRLCLFVGIEPLFLPFYEPKRNYWVESFHSLWLKAFWSREEFTDLAHLQAETPAFLHWYRTRYRPPSLGGKTPAQMGFGFSPFRMTTGLRQLIPETLPITAGRIHFIRKVERKGSIRILNETWPVGERWAGEYVWAIAETAEQKLTLWYKADAQARWKRLKTRRFKLREPVQPLRLEFKRSCARCPDHWPG